jgi:hypothetical protein
MTEMETIPKGSIFTISTGEYSNYCIRGIFKATEDINPNALIASWLAAHPEQKEKYCFQESDFIASLSLILEPIDAFEWHLSDDEIYLDKIND